ncbi:MAG TPA: ribosome maturation factor RimM [Anaeromyxobacter sp.]|nr:ribosome maturation factor RimM [Anaeromyxobacter sp.]
MALVVVGKVVRAVGLKGHLGVAGTEGALPGVDEIALRRGAGDVEVRRVLDARPQGRVWAVRIEGVADRTAAEAWVGAEVLVEREALGEAEEGTFFWSDLEGLPVVTASGEAVGKVTGFYATGAADVLVVTGERGERLVPLAPYVQVDLEARRIVVDPPEGLLD